jgi:hypothetical protein
MAAAEWWCSSMQWFQHEGQHGLAEEVGVGRGRGYQRLLYDRGGGR